MQKVASIILLLLLSGCAVHYYDQKTGTEHLWGFGHLKMRVVPQPADQPPFTNAVVAYVTGIHAVGFYLGAGGDFGGLMAGWDSRSRMIISGDNAHFCLVWPTNTLWLPWDLQDRLFTVRVGPDFPFTTNPKTKPPSP